MGKNRDPIELLLVQDVHPSMQHVEEYWRIDVALVVRTEYGGAADRQVFLPKDTIADAAQPETKPDASMPKLVENALPSEDQREKETRRPEDEDVERDTEVRCNRPDGGNQHRGDLNEKGPSALPR